jgi:hypothetical protein
MKVDEVMLGDIVSVSGRPIHVTLAVLNNWSDSIEPIPLTPEILEKNGFVKGDTMDFEDEIYCVELFNIHYDNEERRFWVCNFFESEYGTCEINHLFQIKHVHQLQHALKLCGINKEIEL